MNSHQWLVPAQKGSMVLIHGTGEHYGRYEHVAAFFNERGWSVFTGDLPGWGRSAGRRGHIDSFQQYIEAVEDWMTKARSATPAGQPLYLLGHSLGGLVATRYVQMKGDADGLAGLILTSPCLELKLQVPAWKAQLARMLDQFMPTLAMPNGVKADMVSRDVSVQAAYVSDPLNYSKVSVRWFQELLRAMKSAWADRDHINVPVLVLQAGDDAIIHADAIERFTGGLHAPNSFHRFSGLRHEVLNEPEKEQIMEQMEAWMEQMAKLNVTY